jgi:uncharacterized membrane protein
MFRKLPHAFFSISRFAVLIPMMAGVLMLASVNDAKADFRVCNGTQSLVGGAIGYRTAEGWVTEGWWQIPASSCATLIEGQLESRYYYLYAEDAGGGGRWAGESICVWLTMNSELSAWRIVSPAAFSAWVSRNMTPGDKAAGWSSFQTLRKRKKAIINEAASQGENPGNTRARVVR